MSIQAIHQCHNEIHKISLFSKKNNEQNIKGAYFKLINHYCEKRHLLLVSEVSIISKNGNIIRPDGIVKNILTLNCGYWESKANVDLDKEIDLKINAGYPLTNTLFQDDKFAVLYQDDKLVLKVSVHDIEQFDKLLTQFVSYKSKEVTEFDEAINQFKNDLPTILIALREMIIVQEKDNPLFMQSRQDFLTLCRSSINPDIKVYDINEMLLQHILTEEIFVSIFSDAQFFQDNNIAKELYKVEDTFFKGINKRNTLAGIQHYYALIKSKAASISDHHDKQRFLKAIYENFYKAYNPKAADKLGIVYTPHEIVKFQIESVEHLLEKHFKKSLNSDDIKILDPCTGTGTYICEIIEYLNPKNLPNKYKNDIFANELGLLPYYIANLNIEYTYQQRMNEYVYFDHICWVDTLDNTGFELKGTNTDLFGLTVENTARIKEQNKHKISVIIGNPPYNAKQENYNQQNANRAYKGIDDRIKETYVKYGTAQNKNQVYDMYLRFFRWASDRINQEQGIIAFITNNSFINRRAFDGVRLAMQKEFNAIYCIDLGGDITNKQDKSLATGNVFNIKTGVAIVFLVKNNKTGCHIYYSKLSDKLNREEKLNYLYDTKIEDIEFDKIIPDDENSWLSQVDNDFDSLIPVCDKDIKAGNGEKAIFRLFSRGVETTRDEWVYDFDKKNLNKKIKFFVDKYNKNSAIDEIDLSIKWSSSLEAYKNGKGKKLKFSKNLIINTFYRPFVKVFHYSGKEINHRLTHNHYDIFGSKLDKENLVINFILGISKPFSTLISNKISDLNILSPAAGGTQCLPLYVYDSEGNQHDNITDWALNQFKKHYREELTQLDIFHYVYAVLHNPEYRKKYELNLKREFPRIPFYADFFQWAEWGKKLMELHLNYETADKYPLKRHNSENAKIPKAKLKIDKENGLIILDDNTYLSEIPPEAWEYKLGNRCALEWILDQYKEKKPKDTTIEEKFNTYKFADYKEQVIDLLMRVCTVSVETVRIVNQLTRQSKIYI